VKKIRSTQGFAFSVTCSAYNRLIFNTISKTSQLLQIPFPTYKRKGCRQPWLMTSCTLPNI